MNAKTKAELGVRDEVRKNLEGADLPEDVRRAVLASEAGEVALARWIAKGELPESVEASVPEEAPNEAVFLEEVSVRGFRGIGPECVLKFAPEPGLVLVTGRNGAGKSSLVDGLEMLLTGTSSRWNRRKTKVWRAGWKNFDETRAELRASFQNASSKRKAGVVVTRRWDEGAGLEEGALEVKKGRASSSLDALGWTLALEQQRPLLSYAELPLVAESPAKSFDALDGVLGLGEVDPWVTTLREARLELDRQKKVHAKELPKLRTLLGRSEDERVPKLLELLEKKLPDLDEVERVLIEGGDDEDDQSSRIAKLRKWTATPSVDGERWHAVADELEAAMQREDALQKETVGRFAKTAKLMAEALVVSEEKPEACPVCERPWSADERGALKKRLKEMEQLSTRVRETEARQRRALSEAHRAAASVPVASLRAGAEAGLCPDLSEVFARLEESRDLGGTALIQALRETCAALAAGAEALREGAKGALSEIEVGFRDQRNGTLRYLEAERQVREREPRRKVLKAAEDWLKSQRAQLRDERFFPIANRVKELWAELGGESDVSLEGVSLKQSGTRRSIDMETKVGEHEAEALSVISQGELSALSLSLFLPRTELPGSPFRFVIIDDPVQALDRDKVEALARVLAKVAEERQVVVFSHDERLREAIEDLESSSTVLELIRGEHSQVSIRDAAESA